MFLSSFFKRLLYGKHTPSITVEISRGNLLYNLHAYQKTYPELLFAPVLKSNAYGHGLILVAEILKKEPVPFLVLDSLYEARQLRAHGIRVPLLIIGYTSPENIHTHRMRDIAFTITSMEQLHQLATVVSRKTHIHLKIDTGMHRQGIMPDELSSALTLITQHRLLVLEGICSHFADADGDDPSYTQNQITLWNTLVRGTEARFPTIRYVHTSASAGTSFLKEAAGNLVRLGLGLYGIDPASRSVSLNLRPALSLKTILTSIRRIEPGDRIGYNGTFTAQKPMTIASIPVGYFEGLDRRLSNRGAVFVNSTHCPIVGRVSMNITTIDVSLIDTPRVGMEVLVISNDPTAQNCIASFAQQSETIPWELLVHIPSHLRRNIVS